MPVTDRCDICGQPGVRELEPELGRDGVIGGKQGQVIAVLGAMTLRSWLWPRGHDCRCWS